MPTMLQPCTFGQRNSGANVHPALKILEIVYAGVGGKDVEHGLQRRPED